MIVVIGSVQARLKGTEIAPSGSAASIAGAAAAAGALVEVATRLGEDPAGDAVLLAFARSGIGHVATLRDAARPTALDTGDEDEELTDLDPGGAMDAAILPEAARHAPDPHAPTLDGPDVALALRYLPDYRVLVLVHPASPGVLEAVVFASDWGSAHLVVVADPEAPAPSPDIVPAQALVVAAAADADGVAGLIGRYAAAVDGGEAPEVALRATLGALT